jgi:hypothetical protein
VQEDVYPKAATLHLVLNCAAHEVSTFTGSYGTRPTKVSGLNGRLTKGESTRESAGTLCMTPRQGRDMANTGG